VPAGFWIAYVEKLAIAGIVLGLLYLLARVLRHGRFLGRPGRIALIESATLAPHAALHLVRVGSRYFLIGSAAQVGLLAELAPREVAERDDATR
jgi:flagellar biogenesis protein FliO